jgi:hypothetical protein
MSYDIDLCDPVTKEVLKLDENHFMAGGTYAIGGTNEMCLNVTYNYRKAFVKTMGEKGIRTIYGMTGADSIPLLDQAIDNLADDKTDNYWEPTEGNAKAALIQLKTLAKMRPDGIWRGD